MDEFIDLTHTIENSMPVYPGDPEVELKKIKELNRDNFNDFRLGISMHSGTHIDSAMHLDDSEGYISSIPVKRFAGEGCILDVSSQPVIKMKAGYSEKIKEGCIVLLYTGYGNKYGSPGYFEGHPVVDGGLAEFLIKMNIRMLGMDTPSPDRFPYEIHKMLFKNKILIAENLANLDKLLHAGGFEVIALPLKIMADSSIARVVARIR
jgi:kynurenine formamidase